MKNPSSFVNEIIDWRVRRVNYLKISGRADDLMDAAMASRLRETVANQIRRGAGPGNPEMNGSVQNTIVLLLAAYLAQGGSMTLPSPGSVLDLISAADQEFAPFLSRYLFGPTRFNADGIEVLTIQDTARERIVFFVEQFLSMDGGNPATNRFLHTLFGPIDAQLARKRMNMVRDSRAGRDFRLVTMLKDKSLIAAALAADALDRLGSFFQDDIVKDVSRDVLAELCGRVDGRDPLPDQLLLTAWDHLKDTPDILWNVANKIGALSPGQIIGVVTSFDPTRLLAGAVVVQRFRRGVYA